MTGSSPFPAVPGWFSVENPEMSESESAYEAGWYCVRARPKSEHIAARNLQHYANLDEVFCPRIRYEKPTRRGKVWFVEALFPGYFFARFELAGQLRTVNAAPGVSGVLHFADEYPRLHDALVADLKSEFPEEEAFVREIRQGIAPGDEVVITEGPMKGLQTIVTRLTSGNERVAVLLEWLGQEREAEVSMRAVMRPGDIRRELR